MGAKSNDASTTAANQRNFPRVSSRCLVSYRAVNEQEGRLADLRPSAKGLLQNISGGGVCIRMPQDPGKGTLLALNIKLPQFPTAVISIGKVMWIQQVGAEHDVGIEFWWIGWEDPKAQEEIRGFISTSLADTRLPDED